VPEVGHVHRPPTPRQARNTFQHEALHEPGRHVDQEAIDVAERDRLKVEGNGFEWPTLDQFCA